MSTRELVKRISVGDDFRSRQIVDRFGLEPVEAGTFRVRAELPDADRPWRIGAVVGPSGAGKSLLVREEFGPPIDLEGLLRQGGTLAERFGDAPFQTMVDALFAVGLRTPRQWLTPLESLSCGERFRAGAALAFRAANKDRESQEVIVLDEFARSLDDDTGRFAVAGLARAVRAESFRRRLVAVGCPKAFLPWLEADWVLELPSGRLHWGRLPRPRLELEIVEAGPEQWPRFAPHHYLNHRLPAAAICRLGLLDGAPAAFAAVSAAAGRIGVRRISRLVVAPEFQGIGVGSKMLDACAAEQAAAGRRVRIVASHPAVARHLERSPRWRIDSFHPVGRWAAPGSRTAETSSWGRPVVAAEFLGSARAA